jgi:putative tryptophan/tyrosine transport system substrate-binding protein
VLRARRSRIAGLLVAVLLLAGTGAAQSPPKTARIGVLSFASGPTPTMDIVPGLRDLGWIEGQNLTVEYRWASGKTEQLTSMAAELVRLKPDVIVTSSTPAAQAAKQATTTIPIVMTFVADPLGSGLVPSLARPGGNLTGVSTLAAGLVAKRLELLKAVAPKATRIALLLEAGTLGERALRDMVDEAETAAHRLGIRLQTFEARRPADLEMAFASMKDAQIGGVVVFPSAPLFEARRAVAAQAARTRLPTIYPWREGAELGLMSYSTNFPDMYRRAATYVDKILRGARPADLPIQQPTRFELVVNLRTAKALGLTIPQSIVERADDVIR